MNQQDLLNPIDGLSKYTAQINNIILSFYRTYSVNTRYRCQSDRMLSVMAGFIIFNSDTKHCLAQLVLPLPVSGAAKFIRSCFTTM